METFKRHVTQRRGRDRAAAGLAGLPKLKAKLAELRKVAEEAQRHVDDGAVVFALHVPELRELVLIDGQRVHPMRRDERGIHRLVHRCRGIGDVHAAIPKGERSWLPIVTWRKGGAEEGDG